MKFYPQGKPKGYDSAMGFNNAKGANHKPAHRSLNDMASQVGRTATFGTTSHKVLGGSPKDFSETSMARNKSPKPIKLNQVSGNNPYDTPLTFNQPYSAFRAKQVPNTSPVEDNLTSPRKVIRSMNDTMVFNKAKRNGKSMIFHKQTS